MRPRQSSPASSRVPMHDGVHSTACARPSLPALHALSHAFCCRPGHRRHRGHRGHGRAPAAPSTCWRSASPPPACARTLASSCSSQQPAPLSYSARRPPLLRADCCLCHVRHRTATTGLSLGSAPLTQPRHIRCAAWSVPATRPPAPQSASPALTNAVDMLPNEVCVAMTAQRRVLRATRQLRASAR